VAAWLSGSALVSIKEVTVSSSMGDRLVADKPREFVTSHSGRLSMLPSAGQKTSTGQRAVTLCGWGLRAGMVHSTCG